MSLRPDAQAFDEIRIFTVPRYKESELSGDEWRISATVDFYRKGEKVHSIEGYRNVETVCNFLPYFHANAIDDGHAYFASVGTKCDQEGCAKEATVYYKMASNFCREGHQTAARFKPFRQFCDKHRTRGDCALEDADRNYTQVPPPTGEQTPIGGESDE